jgi:hypothetical protein
MAMRLRVVSSTPAATDRRLTRSRRSARVCPLVRWDSQTGRLVSRDDNGQWRRLTHTGPALTPAEAEALAAYPESW